MSVSKVLLAVLVILLEIVDSNSSTSDEILQL